MDEEQIKALIASEVSAAVESTKAEFLEANNALKTEITESFTEAQQGLAASLTREIKKLSAKPKEEKSKEEKEPLELKALQTQLGDTKKELDALTQKLEDERKAAFESASTAALASAIADSKAQNPSALRKLLAVDYAGKLQKDDSGDWFVVDGDRTVSLKDSVSAYLKTDEGAHFVAPSNVQGSGSKESTGSPPPDNPAPKTPAEILAAFDSGEAVLKV